jgi:hypothetical protein
MSFDEVHEIPHKARQLGVTLHESPGSKDNRPSHISLPVPLIARRSQAGFGARRASLGFLGEDPPGLGVIDHCHGIAALALRRAIDPRRQIGSVFRSVGGLRHLRLTREVAREAIFPVGKLNPFLGEHSPRNREHQGGRHECQAHDLSILQVH